MSRKTLLLNASYETIGFISFKKLIKLLFHGQGAKVEVVSEWSDESIIWASGRIKYPAIVRMKYYVRSVQRKLRFNRKAIFKRDGFICQYCSIAMSGSELTLDHILPKCRGGQGTWLNCTTSCFSCNSKKGNKTPDEAGMKLISKPFIPTKNMLAQEYKQLHPQHDDWQDYFKH